jgi:HEPN domain-containing protein
MNAQHHDSACVQEWLEQAEQDLLASESLLEKKNRKLLNPACYHAQQAAEKYLKSLLLHLGIKFPFSHDMRLLLELVTEQSKLDVDIAEVISLTRYATQTRYPGDWEPIDRREATEALAIAGRLGNEVTALISKRRIKDKRKRH